MDLVAMGRQGIGNVSGGLNTSDAGLLSDAHVANLVSTVQASDYPVWEEEDEHDTVDRPSVKSFFIVVYCLLAVVCIVGNAVVLVVMTRCPTMRTRTNIFLCHLAVADLCVGVICIVPSLVVGILATWIAGPLGVFLCKFYNFVEELNLTVSILLLVLIAAERYVAIMHPLKARRLFTRCRMYSTLVVIWAVAVLHNVPLLFMFETETTPSGTSYCYKSWTINLDLPVYVTLTFVLTYVIPLTCMSAMYIRISFVLWRSNPHSILQRENNSAGRLGTVPGSGDTGLLGVDSKSSAGTQPQQAQLPDSDRSCIPLARSSYRQEEKDAANVNDPDLINHTKGDDNRHRYQGEDGSSGEEEGDSNPAPSVSEQTEKAGAQRCRRCSRHSRSSCSSRTSCSSSSACTSITTIENNAPACLHDACCPDKTCSSSSSHGTRGVAGDSSGTSSSAAPCLAACPQPLSGHLATPLLSAQAGVVRPPPTAGPLTSPTLSPSPPPPPPSSTTTAATALLSTAGSGDGVYVLRRGNSTNTSCRLRVTSHRVLMTRRKVVRLLVAVLLAFALTVLPHHVRAVCRVWLLPGSTFWVSGFAKYMMQIMLYLNSALNPVLYGVMSDSFRRSARQVLCCTKAKPRTAAYAAPPLARGAVYRHPAAAGHRDLF